MQRRAGQKSEEKKRGREKETRKREQRRDPLPFLGNCGCKSTTLAAAPKHRATQRCSRRLVLPSSPAAAGFVLMDRQRLRPLFVSLSSPLRTQILQDPRAREREAGT
ncbi:hypothetical protein MRX96_026308 [Rhipicephalus microplus]